MVSNLKFKNTILLFFLSLICYAQEYSGKGEDINQILKNIKEFSRAYVGANYDTLTAFYSVDAKIFPAGVDIIKGHDAIKKRWLLPKGTKILSHKIVPREIKIIEDYAYEYGYYQGSTSSKEGQSSNWKGKYVIVWKKVNNDWKIYLDIWNKIDDENK